MKSLFKTIIFSFLFLLLIIQADNSEASDTDFRLPVAIQPIGNVDMVILKQVKGGLENRFCGLKAEIQPEMPLPKHAYYAPRKRYRSLKLLRHLRYHYSTHVKQIYHRIIGITAKDISTTKGKYHDWGIFGQAFMHEGPGIASTFRLKRKAKSRKHFYKRLIKVVNHELAHSLGLYHCPTKNCIMEDAKGSIKSVDDSDGTFCKECRRQLPNYLWVIER